MNTSYNRYLAVASRTLRRSLKEGPRLQAERRGEMDLRFAKWQVWEAFPNRMFDETNGGRRAASRAR